MTRIKRGVAAHKKHKKLLNAGFSTLFAGEFLAQSAESGTLWTPYVMWTFKF